MRGRLARLGVMALAMALAVGAFELALRAFGHVAPQLELDIYRKDRDGLLLLRPNVTRRHVAPRWDVGVHINSAGWRDFENKPEQGDAVIVGLGDSQAFGWGVELKDTFYSIVERKLNQSRPTRLIKAAVPGTTTLDQVKVLERLIPIYHPDEVMLTFFVGNDFVENAVGGSDRLEVDGGLLALRPRNGAPPEGLQRVKRWIARRSHVAQLLRAVQFNLTRPDGASDGQVEWDSWMRDFAQIHLKDPNETTRRGIAVTLETLDRAVVLCEANAVERFGLIVIPRSLQAYPEEARQMREALGVSKQETDLDAAERLFERWQAGNQSSVQVWLVDPLPLFRSKAKAGAELYYTPDAHLSPEGHATVAEAVVGSLAAR